MRIGQAIRRMSDDQIAKFIYIHNKQFTKGLIKIKEFLQLELDQLDADGSGQIYLVRRRKGNEDEIHKEANRYRCI